MATNEFFVPGAPATFATRGEKPWRETLLKHMTPGAESLGVGGGVSMDFVVKSLVRNGHPFDLDNLCEPVFWALCSAGAFGGKRGGIGWWNATRRVGSCEGCHIAIHTAHSRSLPDGPPVIRAEFPGPLPQSATDKGMLQWASSVRAGPLPCGTLTLLLAFGGHINIGDICTGRVKNVIDCLTPWLGGSVGSPADHRISSLFVQRLSDQPEDHVKLAMWHAPATNEIEAGRGEQDECFASMDRHADASLRDELEAARARVRALEEENAAMRERLERVERAIGVR